MDGKNGRPRAVVGGDARALERELAGGTPLVQPVRLGDMGVRYAYTGRYSFAILTGEALSAIADVSPVGAVEECAGGGYLAGLLRGRGVYVEAFDVAPAPHPEPSRRGEPPYNAFIDTSWGGVRQAPAGVSASYPELTLVLCWPPEQDPAARIAVESYRGGTLVYIGELLSDGLGRSPHMADEEFFALLRSEWTMVREVAIPQWRVPEPEHDTLSIWRRTGRRHPISPIVSA